MVDPCESAKLPFCRFYVLWLINQLDLLRSTSAILQHFPTNFRQLTAPIRALIVPLMTEGSHQVPKQVRAVAIDLFASLHLTAGKAQIPQGWAADMRGALLGLRQAFEAASVDGWLQSERLPVSLSVEDRELTDLAGSPDLAASAKYPSDPASRLPIAFDHLEGWCEVIIAFLRYVFVSHLTRCCMLTSIRRTSSRAVPVPIGQITQVALRCLDLTQDTPVSYPRAMYADEEGAELSGRRIYLATTSCCSHR